MPSKVSITKSFIDELADAVALKNGVSTYMSLNSMISLVGSMYGKKEYDDLREGLILKTYSSSTNISGATEIPDYAMAGLKSLQSVSFQSAQKIGNFAFADCKNLVNISIPLATEIGNNAFQNCSSITNVSFPSATKVGDYAFQNCKSLSQFSGSRVNSVGSHAFQNCTNLETPNFLLNPSGINVGAYAFQSCSLISYATISKCASTVNVGDEGGGYTETKYITADYAFQDCKALTSASFTGTYNAVLPRGIFKGCSSLSSVESMPNGNLGSFAFDGCVMLNPRTSTGYFPEFGEGTFRSCLIDFLSSPYAFETDAPKSIPSYAFQYCSQLSYISFRQMRKDKLEYIGGHAFEGCTKLQSADFMRYVKSIYSSAFQGCTSLSSIGNITSLVTLGDYAFANCVTLSSAPANMLKNLSEIKQATFSNCVNLSGTIVVGSSCRSIGWSAFYNCSNITSFYGSNVRNIGMGAFRNCTNLSAVTLSTSLYNYGAYGIYEEAFKSCGILSIDLGDLRSIRASTFENCLSLSSVVGSSVQSIDYNAFKSCKALTSVSFPMCSYIGNAAFNRCFALTEISFPSCSYVGSDAFYSCESLTTAYLPSCKTVSLQAFCGCKNLSSVTLSTTCSFGNYAFYSCTSLMSFDLQSTTRIPNGLFMKCGSMALSEGGYSVGSGLSVIYANSVTSIGSQAFAFCSGLMSLYLLTDSSTPIKMNQTLVSSQYNPFYSTPMLVSIPQWGGSTGIKVYGKIYVRSSMYTMLQSSSAWSALFNRGVMTIYEE